MVDSTVVAEHEAAIAGLKGDRQEIQDRLRGIRQSIAQVSASVQELVDRQLASNETLLREAAMEIPEAAMAPWDGSLWDAWLPHSTVTDGDRLRVGRYVESRSGTELHVPVGSVFIGAERSVVIRSSGEEGAQSGSELLQSLVVRAAAMFPQQSRFTLLDPASNGLAFPMARHLERVSPPSGDTRRDLDAVIADMQRVISTYLDAGTTSFEEIPDEMRLNERFHFVFAADFPNRYDLRAAEALQTIARSGPRAGVYLFVHHNLDHQPLADVTRYEIENPVVVDTVGAEREYRGLKVHAKADSPPSADLQDLLLTRIKNAPPIDHAIAWEDVADLPEEDWWTSVADTVVRAPLGRHGANQELSVWFGEHEREGRTVAHGVLGAMSGSGKSSMFHALIASLAIRYSPEELRFYLIDGKYGVEFQPYRDLPHAEVVSLRTTPELARSVLAELVDEMERRNTLFAEQNVTDLGGYRRLGRKGDKLPRLLLFVDEFQQLFENDMDTEGSTLLLKLSQQGRSAGIHMLLASQTLDAKGMHNRSDIFANIHLRLAMQMASDEIAGLQEFGPKGRALISATADRPGRITLNDNAGDDNSNTAGKVALITSDTRDRIVSQLVERARELPPDVLPSRVVFNGLAQPALLDNPHVSRFLDLEEWPTSDSMESMARTPVKSAGLGVSDWLAGERPIALFLGQEFNVRGHARAILRRRPGNNLMLVGDRSMERVAMMAALLASAVLGEKPGDLQVLVADRSVVRTGWEKALAVTAEGIKAAGYSVQFTREEADVPGLVNAAHGEMQRRLSLGEDQRFEQPTMLVVINEPDRVTDLLRLPDDYGYVDSEIGKILRGVAASGPTLGIHLVLGFATLRAAKSVIAERTIQEDFIHRVAMQMSEDDSFVFVRSAEASKLQIDSRPVVALQFDSAREAGTKFKPYSLDAATVQNDLEEEASLLDEIADIMKRLGTRS